MGTKKVVVVDLDGTLCDERHRVQFAQAKEWDEFHSRLHMDKPYDDVHLMLKMLSFNDFYIYAVTARSERWRNLTEDWLKKYKMPVNALLMRKDNDYARAGEVKLTLLEEHFGDKAVVLNTVFMVLENNSRSVELMRNYGLNVWQVREE